MKKDDTEREGFNPEELGQASSYEGETEMAQRMRRGDESEGDPDSRDTAGATRFKDTEEGRTDRDTVPRAQADAKNSDTTMSETMSSFTGTNDEKRTDEADAASGRK